VSEDRTPDSLPLFGEGKENTSPGDGSVLRHLAQTLSVTKTLKRFPSLTPKHLQEIFLRCAEIAERARGEEKPCPPDLPPEGPKPSLPPTPSKEFPDFFIHADGASRGNPGEAGAGAVISDSRGRTVKELKIYLGMASNNVAEYQAATLALERAFELGAKNVTLSLDSELVVRQLRGEYRVREPHLKILHEKARETLNRFSRYSILHIPREENRRADQLANEAIDQKNK
jgi:ribonuclease HI